ncbi:MAG: hypothetical protein AAF551_11490 [Bacteroidota bacterium]
MTTRRELFLSDENKENVVLTQKELGPFYQKVASIDEYPIPKERFKIFLTCHLVTNKPLPTNLGTS